MCPNRRRAPAKWYPLELTGSLPPQEPGSTEPSLVYSRAGGATNTRPKATKSKRGAGKATMVIRWTLFPSEPGTMEPLSGLVEISLESGLRNFSPWLTTLVE
jgi:hypothetical protein